MPAKDPKARRAEWRERHREQLREKGRRYYRENKKHCRQLARKAYRQRKARDPEGHSRRILNAHLLAKYDITVEDYEALRQRQKSRCALCRGLMEFGGRIRSNRAVIDHDHNTGRLRGLIHDRCNKLLGHAGDSSRLLHQAVRYLTEFRKR